MRILEVNGTSLLGATHQEAVNALREAGNEIQIIVCKGYDKSSLIHSIGSGGGMSTGFNSSANRLGSRASETGSELSQSVSSLDRDDGAIDESLPNASVSTTIFFFINLTNCILFLFCMTMCLGRIWCESSERLNINQTGLVCGFYIHFFVLRWVALQTNDVFESSSKDVARIHTPDPHSESNVERVSETSQDVALLNSEQTLVSTKEKSTKDKVSNTCMWEN